LSEFPIEMRFLLCVLAAWRLIHLVVAEDGPGDIVVKLRIWLGGSFLGLIMDCFYCASVWVAAPFAFLITQDVLGWLVSWLAISGAAALLEQASRRETMHSHYSNQPDEKAER
jgi:hypothetical protein